VAKTQVAKRRSNAVGRYLRETAAELRKVSWPTRHEATQLTILVLVVVAFTSLLLGLFDFAFARLIGLIIGLG
jgi:preprotein translocase subunit SecE